MRSIKNKISTLLTVIILSFVALLIVVVAAYSSLLNRYQQINSNIIYEQKLKDGVWSIVEKCYNDFKTGDFTEYEEELKNVRNIEKILDEKTRYDKDTAAAYQGVKNSLNLVISNVDEAKRNWEDNNGLGNNSAFFDTFATQFEFVKQNITDLILIENRNIATVSQEINAAQTSLDLVFTLISTLVISISFFYALNIIKKITDPITSLTLTAKKIANGNIDINVEKKLLGITDEMGSLSQSINQMVLSLREKLSEIKNEKDRMNTTIESMSDGLIVTDKEATILLINTSALKLLDLTGKNVIGKKFQDIVTIHNKNGPIPNSERPIAKMIATSKPQKVDIEDHMSYCTIKGRLFPVKLIITPLKDNILAGAVLIFNDVSAEKKLNDSRTNFISVSSHQLRTPLSAIQWYSEMLADGDAGKLNKEQKHFVETINHSTQRMSKLINLLLQIARVEMGRVRIVPANIDLKLITQELVKSLEKSLHEKKQVVKITSSPAKLPVVKYDREALWQIISNLVTNAIRYSPDNETIQIRIALRGEFIEYSVKDHGIGIPENQKANIFEKFFRASNATAKVPEGSGLGLFLAKSLVEDSGGKLWFESEEGKGTTFYFTIPTKGVKARAGEVTLMV